MKVIAVVLLGLVACATAYPLEIAKAGTQTKKTEEGIHTSADADASGDTPGVAKTSSAVGPDGAAKSAAIAAHKPGTGGSLPTEDGHGHVEPGTPVGPGTPIEPSSGGDIDEGDMKHGGHGGHHHGGHGGHHHGLSDVTGPIAPAPIAPAPIGGKKPTKFQKVDATADMNEGTAFATASKRNTFQQLRAKGNVAVAKATENKQVDGSVAQDVTAEGGKFAVASAVSGPNRRDVNNAQHVKAQGNKAIASAANNKNTDNNLQNVNAIGGEFAMATATNVASEAAPIAPAPIAPAPIAPAPIAPAPGPMDPKSVLEGGQGGSGGSGGQGGHAKRDSEPPKGNTTAQNVKAKGDKSIASGDTKTAGNVSTLQDIKAEGGKFAMANAKTSE